MACCGPSKSPFDPSLFKTLRKADEKILLKLDGTIYEFDPDTETDKIKWKGKKIIKIF